MIIRIKSKKTELPLVDKFCIILLALTPILQHYKGLFVNASVTILLIVMVVAVLKLISYRTITSKQFGMVIPLIMWFFFKVVDHGTTITEAGQAIVFSIVIIAIANQSFDTDYFVNVVCKISLFACIVIIIQYISYYLLHHHIQCVPTSLLLDKSNQWVKLAKTGRSSISGRNSRFYRPSAFFLEPSHMFLYLFVPLLMKTMGANVNKTDKKQAILLSVGMLFSTSGMGIVTVIATWGLFLLKNKSNDGTIHFSNILKPKNMMLLILIIILMIVMYFQIPFFQNSVDRIIGSGTDYTNAIDGRIGSSSVLLSTLSGKSFWIGVSDNLAGIEYNMSGYAKAFYCYGIIGTIISYVFYLKGAIQLKHEYRWIAILVLITSYFSAHTHSTFFMIYMTFIFADGYKKCNILSQL